MQLVGIGDLMHPGRCLVCGSGNREQGYVNLGVYYEYEGNMYLCFLCLTEAAEIIGMLTSEEASILNNNSSEIFEENVKLKKELEDARQRLGLFDSALLSLGLSPLSEQSATEGASEGEGRVSETGDDVHSGADSGESESAKSVEVEQSSRVSSVKRSNTSRGNSSSSTIEL